MAVPPLATYRAWERAPTASDAFNEKIAAVALRVWNEHALGRIQASTRACVRCKWPSDTTCVCMRTEFITSFLRTYPPLDMELVRADLLNTVVEQVSAEFDIAPELEPRVLAFAEDAVRRRHADAQWRDFAADRLGAL